MQRSYPPESWDIEWIADDGQRLAFNVRRCLYVDTLTAYGAPELIPHICAFDDWMFEALQLFCQAAALKTTPLYTLFTPTTVFPTPSLCQPRYHYGKSLRE